MPDFKMRSVTSSDVDSVGYDASTKTMRVRFKKGGSYDYSDVSQEMFDGVMGAESVGRYLHREIKPNCPFSKCPES